MSASNLGFRFLNADGAWVGFSLAGLELRGDGSLALAALPGAASPPHPVPNVATLDDRPAGLAFDAAGNLYYSLTAQHVIERVDACTGEVAALPCLSGPGSNP